MAVRERPEGAIRETPPVMMRVGETLDSVTRGAWNAVRKPGKTIKGMGVALGTVTLMGCSEGKVDEFMKSRPATPTHVEKVETDQNITHLNRKAEMLKKQAERMKAKAQQGDKLKKSGQLGENEKTFDFLGTQTPESKLPTWYKMEIDNATGKTGHNQEKLTEAKIDRLIDNRSGKVPITTEKGRENVMKEVKILKDAVGDEVYQSIHENFNHK